MIFNALVSFYAHVMSALLAFERARQRLYYYIGGGE